MNRPIKNALASASCVLLSVPALHAEEPLAVGEWDISTGFLFYSETDRVQAVEPIINAKYLLDTDESVNIKLTLDTLTGASASGAIPSTQIQTFTRPSGNGSYVTPGQVLPLDDTFKDTRAAIALNWYRPGPGGTQSDLGFSLSREYDYQSIGTSATFAKNLNNANTTISAGIALGADSMDPVGGKPVPFALMQPEDQLGIRDSGSTNKTLIDMVAGITQVVDVNSLFQINYSFSSSEGYLSDPYKIISVIDPETGTPIFSNTIEPTLPNVVYENRPESRVKQSVYGQYKRYLENSGDVLDLSYRFMFDDWGINSHTVDLRYRKTLSNRKFLQPHLRLYQQSAADFYTPFFVNGNQPLSGNSSAHASADYRLGEFTGYTLGLEYGQVNQTNSWSVALEYYLQTGDEPAGKFGDLTALELNPDVSAVMFRVLYDY